MNKRNFLLSMLAVSGLMFTSCSDDDNNNNNNGGNNQNSEVMLFTSSNTSGKISVTDLNESGQSVLSFNNNSTDSDGIYYDASRDRIIQASRTDNRLNIYSDVSTAIDNSSTGLNIAGSSQADEFDNAREIAVSGNRVFVVQDEALSNLGQNRILVYEISNNNTLTLQKTYDVNFKLWGIHADDEDLYAVVDNTGDIVEFDNIMNVASGNLTPTKRVTIEGLTRTHGITYSDQDDTMILTDIGNASSDSDGGLIVIENFDDIFDNAVNGSIIPLNQQKRIYGAATTLGNPVDVAYDHVTNRIYVAERLNAGGRVLTFSFPTAATANMAPMEARSEAGVSAVYLSRTNN